jgi:hypothetical protein
MHELFANSATSNSAAAASDYLIVDGHTPVIQVVTPDEIEQSGACQALSARGAKLVASTWSNDNFSQTSFSPEADVVVVSWANSDTRTDFNIPLFTDALMNNPVVKLVLICPPLLAPWIRSEITKIPNVFVVVGRKTQLLTEQLVQATRQVLDGVNDSLVETMSPGGSVRVLEAVKQKAKQKKRRVERLGASCFNSGSVPLTSRACPNSMTSCRVAIRFGQLEHRHRGSCRTYPSPSQPTS